MRLARGHEIQDDLTSRPPTGLQVPPLSLPPSLAALCTTAAFNFKWIPIDFFSDLPTSVIVESSFAEESKKQILLIAI